MTSQQLADDLLAEFQAKRRERERALELYYDAERRAGADPLTATERMNEFAKRFDVPAERSADLEIIKQCMERRT